MKENWVRYEDIEEKREGYYIEYSPVFTGGEFAVLVLHIHDLSLRSKLQSIVEVEIKHWAKRFPTPIFVMTKLYNNGEWVTENIMGKYFILCYMKESKIIIYEDDSSEQIKPRIDLSKKQLALIYSGLPSHTLNDVNEKQAKEAKGRKLFLHMLTFWFCIIPALIAYLGWSSPFFSLLALGYSLYLAYKKGIELWGKNEKSAQDLAKEKEDREKEHHHYHCKLNPDGFLKLKSENFKKDSMEKNQSRIESMRN